MVNQSDNDSSEHADNENDQLDRAIAEILFDAFMDAMGSNSEDDDDYAASPVPQSTEDDNLDVWQMSGDEEVCNANLEPLRQTHAELYDDSNDETSTQSEEHDFAGIQCRSLLENELKTEAENSETDLLVPQDPDALEILNKLASTAKTNQKDIRNAAIRLINSRIKKLLKIMIHLSPMDLSQLKIIILPKIIEDEKTLQYGSLVRNLVAVQSTNVQAAEAIFQKGKLEAAECILGTFELDGQATGEAQQLRKQHLDNRSSRFSYNKPPTSAAFSSKEKKALIKNQAFKDRIRIQDLRQIEEQAQEVENEVKEVTLTANVPIKYLSIKLLQAIQLI
ncbi:MAG: hypothetical protein EZS28_032537 [Streblomastix strix]|uniref:Uncharacterized protein n=1 Tax=Streblomastix strix TaxID=222440 RepID=A0A5J4UMN5_9EUKA|nr:MAG: hypothetical protein EZS28_032537 [Streblomastix strix]